ncbi:MAG: DNA repair protein RecN [Kiritimatiellae bacterium]|nr:DNA repair protein RecN [Kiritimatiellia bacterium]
MLKTLRVKNLALVEKIQVDFEPGLNVITGETGAGKSILIGALALLIGERADKTLIRAGEEACGAEALFDLTDPSDVDAVLEAQGLPACEDGRLVIRRIVKVSGSSQNAVNDSPVTLQVLKQLGECLVDMHGPHDHQSLLNADSQLEMLDAFGHLWKERAAYEVPYGRLNELQKRRAALEGDDRDIAERIDMLAYRVKEIEEAKLREGEEEEIEKEHLVAGNAQRIMELAGEILRLLTEGEGSVYESLTAARKATDELSRLLPEGEGWLGEVDGIVGRVQELDRDMRGVAERIESDPARLRWLDERLTVYQRLRKKYGPTVGDVLAKLEESRTRLHDLQTRGEQLAALEQDLEKVGGELRARAEDLRAKRRAVAEKLAAAVQKELAALGLPHGRFEVEFKEADARPSGMDEIEFQFAPNVGEPMHPLRVIASSGEISRVMLAIKTVLANHDRIPVLVFDEIDTNVGGEMGSAVGRKLAEVAGQHQVICITHLPQVAVHGREHFAVAKYVSGGRTFTKVERLDGKGRVEEVARMLGGRDLTSVTLEHARQMLTNAP